MKLVTSYLFALTLLVSAAHAAPDSFRYVKKNQISFIQNRGQWGENVVFASLSGNRQAALYRNGLYLSMVEAPENVQRAPVTFEESEFETEEAKTLSAMFTFLNPSSDLRIMPMDSLATITHFYYGRGKDKWCEYAPNYGSVLYKNVWDNIDVLYVEEEGVLHQKFIVHEGGSIADIRLASNDTKTNIFGVKIVNTYQDDEINMSELRLANTNGVLSFVPLRKIRGPFVVDTEFSTYIGGYNSEWLSHLLVTSYGEIYISGSTNSPDFPIVNPSFSTENLNLEINSEDFLLRISEDGISIIFSSFIRSIHNVEGVEEGADHTIWLLSNVIGADEAEKYYPITPGAFDTTLNGNEMGLIRFRSNGTIRYSTFLGYGNERGEALSTDKDGNLYVAGVVPSNISCPFITSGTIRTSRNQNENHDRFLLKMNPDVSRVLYGTYYTDNGEFLTLRDMGVDNDGNIVIVGVANNSNIGPLVNSHQPYCADQEDGIIFKINHDATDYIFSSFIGGFSDDGIEAVAFDRNNNIYIGGYTCGSSYPVYKPIIAASDSTGAQCFAVMGKFSPVGIMLFSSHLTGSSSNEVSQIIDLESDECGNIYILGIGKDFQEHFPRRPYSNTSQWWDKPAFLTVIDSSLTSFMLSTYWYWSSIIELQRHSNESWNFMSVYKGNCYFIESTIGDLPTKNALKDSVTGYDDGFITRLHLPFCEQAMLCNVDLPDSLVLLMRDGTILNPTVTTTLTLHNTGSLIANSVQSEFELSPGLAFNNPKDSIVLPSPDTVFPGDSLAIQIGVHLDGINSDTTVTVNTISFFAYDGGTPSYTICSKKLKIHIIDISDDKVSCTLDLPDTLFASDTDSNYVNNPFTISCSVTNNGTENLELENAVLRLPEGTQVRLIPTGDSLRSIGVLGGGETRVFTWQVETDRRSLERGISFTVFVYHKTRILLTQCEDDVIIQPVRGLYCATECIDTIHANREGTFWDPRPIIAKAFITNDLDTSQRATSVEIDLSNAPHFRVLPGIPLLKSKYDHAPKATELFTWQLEPVAPIDVQSTETVVFYYRAGTDTVLRSCTCEIVIMPFNGIAYCSISAPDALAVSGYAYTPNPFDLDYTLTNTGNAQLDVAEISIQLPAFITTTDPVIQVVTPLAPAGQHDITWPLTALTSAYEREAVITVVAKDAEGNILSSCEHRLFLPGVDGLECDAGEEVVLVYDLNTNGYIPNPFNKLVTVHNGLDSALTNVEIEASVSSPDIAITMPVPPVNAISQIPAGQDWITNWTLQAPNLLDKQTTVTVTYRIRSDQYPDWRECSFDVIIPPRQYTYCADCLADGIDTVWINQTNEIMVPVPFQTYVAVANNCTGALTDVRCSIDVPSRLSLAPGETPVKTINRIAPGDTMYVSWDLAAAPAVADESVSVQVSITANEISAPSTCVHTVYIVHTVDIPLAVSKKLLYFQAVRNAALPLAQEVTVYAGYPTEMPWTAQYPSWFSVQPDNNASTVTQTVQPNTTAFPLGRYWGDISYASTQPNAPKTVNVVYDITDGTVGISQPPSTAHGITLHQNYPNPFASSTTISYTTEIAQPITITVYNTLGVPVRVMHQQAEAGNNTIQLSGLHPGLYMVVVRGRDGVAVRRMVGR